MPAPFKREEAYEKWGGKGVPQNSVLRETHGPTMKNPTDVMVGSKAMFLKMLTQLGEFLHVAEAVLDNLKGEPKGDLSSSESQAGVSDTKKVKFPETTESSRLMLVDRRQMRLNQIRVIKP